MTALPGKPAANSAQSDAGSSFVASPGARLREVRVERNLEVPEVAERLNLSPGVVRALEADDYRMLPNATFVKGYLRSYAKEMGINSDELVRAYEAITGCNQPAKVEPIGAPMIRDSRQDMRNMLMALGVLVFVAGAWLLFGGDGKQDASAPDMAAVTTDNGSDTAVEIRVDAEQSIVNPPVIVNSVAESSDKSVVEAAESLNEPVADEAELPTTAPEEVVVAPQAAPVAAVDTPVQKAPISEAAPTIESESNITSSSTDSVTGLLNLRFQGECWVEVRNGSGDLVFSSLKRGGEEVTLRAMTPISVKLGNGDMVAVQFNHEPVPFTTRPDRKVVRLTLGE